MTVYRFSPEKRAANVNVDLPKGIWQRLHVNDDHPMLLVSLLLDFELGKPDN